MIVKSGRRICGSGGALADTPLNQDKTYFEIKVQASGNTLIDTFILFYAIILSSHLNM